MIKRKHPQSILVVDDDLELVRLLGRILRLQGYDVLEATGASDALAVCARPEIEIHLVLMDFKMPETNGLDLAKVLQRFRPTLPVVYMSGSSFIVDTLSADGLPCILKPFVFADLLNFIRTALVSEPSETLHTSATIKRETRSV